MNGIIKCFVLMAIVAFGLSACGGESSGESTGNMATGPDLSLLSPAATLGFSIYEDSAYACSTCHGRFGEGTQSGGPINNINDCPSCVSHAQLSAYNTATMPFTPYDPASCTGECADNVSQYIIEGFIQGKVLPGANSNPAVTVSPTSGLTTTETGGMATFTVSINSLPSAEVSIDLASDNLAEGTVSPSSLTFDESNWQQAQTVMVTGTDDAVLDLLLNTPYNIILSPVVSIDPGYAGIDPDDVAVVNTDDEVPGQGAINVIPQAGLVTSEDGTTATFTIDLGTQPIADVSIGLSSSNVAEGVVTPASLVFDSVNYNIPQTVTITGVDDAASPMVDGNIAYSVITAPAVSNDRSYSGLDATDVAITNNDNDVQPVIMQFTSDAVTPVVYGGIVTLNWLSDGDTCTAGGATANGQWSGVLAASGSQTLTNLTTAGVNTFTLICSKGGIDSVPASVDVTVEPQPGAPVVTLTANPMMNVPYNGSTTLTWNSTDAGTCTASNGWVGAKGLSGTEVINNLVNPSYTFTLACTGLGGTTTVSVMVTVVQPNPTISLIANPTMIGEGQSSTLTWSATDMLSCDAGATPVNAQWTGSKGFSGSQAITNIITTTTFTLNCTGVNNQSYSANAVVTIDPTSTGQYLYSSETFGGTLTCAESFCHGPVGDQGTLINDKNALCAEYTTAELVTYMENNMPLGALAPNCGANCSTKIANYMFLNFYGANTTDCEGGALPLPLPNP